MSLVQSRTAKIDTVTPTCVDARCSEGLSEREHVMLHALEKDVETARQAVRPLLSILKPRRGHVHFAILSQDCPEREQFKHCAYRVSALTLEHHEFDNVGSIKKVLKALRLRHNIRINGLERAPGSITYLKYHIDLEAA